MKLKQDGSFNKPPLDKLKKYVGELSDDDTADATAKELAASIKKILDGQEAAEEKNTRLLALFSSDGGDASDEAPRADKSEANK